MRTLFAVVLAAAVGLSGCADAADPYDPDCVMGVTVEFSSGEPVKTERDARRVFEAFVSEAQRLGDAVFGDAYGNDWRFDAAAYDRTYEGVRYWSVESSWRSPDDGRWRPKHVFHIGENGEVVRLLGCV